MHILVADDQEEILLLTKTLLETKGYKVDTCANGVEVIVKTRDFSYNLILLNLRMPEMNGYDTCSVLKSNKKTHKIPIIAFTAKPPKGEKEELLEKGFDGFLEKPFRVQSLFKSVEEFLKIEVN
ncbi:MAG: response regulator [Candidatus Margulisiibacteriota bacterium]|jgi:CheY-like chemotaxis protein